MASNLKKEPKLLHGWFRIAGIQTGERDLKERLQGLGPLREFAHDATILDLGCAEGLVGKWLMDVCGGKLLHGVDMHEPFLTMARALTSTYDNVEFFRADLEYLAVWRQQSGALLPEGYDIVLCLSVAMKMARPASFLKQAASLSKNYLAIHLPKRIITDQRSANVPLDSERVLFGEGFKVLYEYDGEAEGHRRIYKRNTSGTG